MTPRQLFLKHLAPTSDAPLLLEVDHAEGVTIFDTSGKSYIDIISGIGVSNVGHRHPKVVQAIKDQVDKYLHTMVYGEFVQSPQVQLAKAISDSLSDSLDSVYLVNSGSEAVEGALKLAKRVTARSEIISFKNAYHGSTHGALSATGDENIKRNYRPLLPDFKHIEFNNINELDSITQNTAGVIVELVQGEAGVIEGSQEFISQLDQRCKEMDAQLIVDEIQTGFGRTGTFWAHEQYRITPDILLSAKGMGGGMPIGCFVSSAENMSVFTENPVLGHITTFGGHPVSAAASLATLNVILEEQLLANIDKKAKLFLDKLKHEKVRSIRNKGLMIAVEFESYQKLKPIIDKAIDLGVITDWFLFNDKSMRIAPPLTINESEIVDVCDKILLAIESA